MSPVTTQEVLNERPPTKRVTFADEPQIETLPDYSSTSSSSNEPLYLPPPRPQCTFEPHEQREETIIQPGYWYPTASPLPRLPSRFIELTEKLIDQKLEKEMALDAELFNKKESTKKRGLFSKVLKSKALDFPNRKGMSKDKQGETSKDQFSLQSST
ncbi:unnamed protein product [Rhizopus stolonifer]